jgi:hypothetical protein
MSLSPLNGKLYYKIGPLKVRRTDVTLMERTTYYEVLLCYSKQDIDASSAVTSFSTPLLLVEEYSALKPLAKYC